MPESSHTDLIHRLAEQLARQGLMLTAAESCTGGWLAKVATDVAGSSGWFERGFVTYSNESKQEMLGVDVQTINSHGAVSEATVKAMATGALNHSRADLSVAISGIAGPGGGTPEKPVGTVWFGWCRRGEQPRAAVQVFPGERDSVRYKAVAFALEGTLAML
ncbi:MAG: nicotinamide-nucleotide amidase [Gammaproteobacteria bacterium]|nr:nicotinamide-nucleotide amidase [Gammaproteobacteria bacterium]